MYSSMRGCEAGSRYKTTVPRILSACRSRSKMAMFSKIGAYLKNAWAKEPVIVASFAIGIAAVTVPWFSPYMKYTGMINRAMPYAYPVPVRDDGNLPDIPCHPCDKEGPSLEWLKNF